VVILIRILVISYKLKVVLKYVSHDLEFQLPCVLSTHVEPKQ
jgi:hypothetical protein